MGKHYAWIAKRLLRGDRMAGVKWIKITTDMFDDEKIDYIQSLPEGDTILIIWIRLLTMAGKCNESGKIFLTENIPYTIDALSHKFKKSESIIKLSLKTFSSLGMIQVSDNGTIFISNFDKYQNMEGLEKLKQREYERLKKRKQRQKLKELQPDNSKNDDVPGTIPGQSPGTPSIYIDLDKDIDLDNKKKSIEKENISWKKILTAWNDLPSPIKPIRAITDKRKDKIKARMNSLNLKQEDIIQAINNIQKSSFLQGKNSRGWTIYMDWLFQDDTRFSKVFEEQYTDKEDRDGTNKANNTGPKKRATEDEGERLLRRAKEITGGHLEDPKCDF
jgi:predicted phage replisome organizer